MLVHIGGTFHDVRDDDVIKQVRRNFEQYGKVIAIKFYRHLCPNVDDKEAEAAVEGWCEGLQEGSVLHG
jgi:hypothetical protein